MTLGYGSLHESIGSAFFLLVLPDGFCMTLGLEVYDSTVQGKHAPRHNARTAGSVKPTG